MGLKIQVIKCGRCGKPRGLAHTCITRMDRKRKRGKTKIKPRVTATCRRCGKPRGLNHTCVIRTDFKKRKAAAERQRRKAEAAAKRKAAAQRRRTTNQATARQRHDYRTCTDTDCGRYACLAWKEALAEGHAAGLRDGYEQGYEAATGHPNRRDFR